MWLMHSAKGTTWKNHKYVRKENGRYIYEPTNNPGWTQILDIGGKTYRWGKATRLSGRVATTMSNKESTGVRKLDNLDSGRYKSKTSAQTKKKTGITSKRLKNVASITVSDLKSGNLKSVVDTNKRLINEMLKSKGKFTIKKNKKAGKFK